MTKSPAPKMTKTPRTRAQRAACIRAECEQAIKEAVKGFLNLGRRLLAAKKALPHGEFLEMIEHDLPFTASKAQRLMKIAGDPRLSKAAHGQHLPGSWRTLYELTKLDEETFDVAMSAGTIHPEMTRKEVKIIEYKRGETTPLLLNYEPRGYPVEPASPPSGAGPCWPKDIEPTETKLIAPPVHPGIQDILKALVAASIHNVSVPTIDEMMKFVRGWGRLQPGWLYNFAETMTTLAQELERNEEEPRSSPTLRPDEPY
jgi:hypothetical protein